MGDDMSDSPAAPQPVDPYAQAAAQYGLSTGTAEFNAGLNRTNNVTPMGGSTWSASYPSGGNTGGNSLGLPAGGYGGYGSGFVNIPGVGNIRLPTSSQQNVAQDPYGGAPTYTNTTSL